ncbi:MFS transporter [Kitasatospora sp. NPDC051853]|uniref:MFS transporter n=1 Tax=Kitasatospora sp. NPDC051853 TaxID=3364058 RepID=UPI003788C668
MTRDSPLPVPSPSPAPSLTPGRDRRPLTGVLAAVTAGHLGTALALVTLPWFVLVSTGSATATGLAAFCELVPYVLCKGLGGGLVDRHGARTVSWTTDTASAVAAGLIPLLHWLSLLPLPVLLALVAVTGAVRGPGDLAKDVLLPETADHAGVPLERATGLLGSVHRLADTAGPAVGGLLAALTGPLTGLAVNAASFGLGALLVALLHGPVGRPAPSPATPERPNRAQGLAFLRSEPLLLLLTLLVSFTNLVDAALTGVLLPVWARESGHGPAGIGLAGSAFGLTALLGSLLAAAVGARLPRRPVLLHGYLLAGAPPFLVLALDAPLWLVLAVFALSGCGAGFINPVIGAVLLERTPRHVLGRVRAVRDSVVWAGIPLGGLLGGLAVTTAGATPTLLTAAALSTLAVLLAALHPAWHHLDRTPADTPPRPHPCTTPPCRPTRPSDRCTLPAAPTPIR